MITRYVNAPNGTFEWLEIYKDVLKFVKGLIEEVPDLEIPEVVTGRAHRIGPDYPDKKKQKRRKCVSLSLFDLQRSVIEHHFTELESL